MYTKSPLFILASFIGELSVTTNPESGSTIKAYEYEYNISIMCQIREDGILVNTVWTINIASDLEEGMCTGPVEPVPLVWPWPDHLFGLYRWAGLAIMCIL